MTQHELDIQNETLFAVLRSAGERGLTVSELCAVPSSRRLNAEAIRQRLYRWRTAGIAAQVFRSNAWIATVDALPKKERHKPGPPAGKSSPLCAKSYLAREDVGELKHSLKPWLRGLLR